MSSLGYSKEHVNLTGGLEGAWCRDISNWMTGAKILLVEDEADIAEPIVVGLREEGFQVEWVPTGQKAMQRLVDFWDLLILDLNLPDLAGESILSNLKQLPDYPAVLVLTARGALDDKLALFRQGCDDYLTKPFIFEELVERIRALLRRSQRVLSSSSKYRDLELDPTTHCLRTPKSQVLLTPKESAIVQLLIKNSERVVSRKELLHHVWGIKEEPDTNFIGVHLFNLRKKLGEIARDEWLRTVRSSGFVLCEPGTEIHGS